MKAGIAKFRRILGAQHAGVRLFQAGQERIARMQAAGFSDQQIIDAFIRDYGPGIYLARPSAFGWVVPYVAAALGLVIIWFLVKYRKPKPFVELGPVAIDDPASREMYRTRIEKDLANME